MQNFVKLKKDVLDKSLCCSCGTCVGVCPIKTITYENEKILNPTHECVNCGKCVESCPGAEFDFVEYNKQVFGVEYEKLDDTVGYYDDIYAGYSCDREVRDGAASGGVITSLLLELFEENKISGAVIISQKNDNKTEYEARIVYSVDEIKSAAQSKYKLIPTNAIIGELKKLDGKFAYVGLPCQIQGLRKAMSNDVVLQEKIYVTIGLFCGFNMSKDGTNYLLKKGKLNINNIEEISYRKKINNETGFYAKDKQGKEFFITKHGYTFLNLLYSPKRCWMCYDYTAEFADISVGDAWEQGDGWSRIIVRTENGRNIVKSAKENQKIFIKNSTVDDILKSQKTIVSYKKSKFWFRKSKMHNFPNYNLNKVLQLSNKEKLNAKILYFIQYIGQTKLFRSLVSINPIRLLEYISKSMRK